MNIFIILFTTKGSNLEAKNASTKAIAHVFIHDLRNKAVYPIFIETMTKEIILDIPKIIKRLKMIGSNFLLIFKINTYFLYMLCCPISPTSNLTV
ncbi:hypothetical protein bcgnr5412_39530 [Bacillus cereus]